MANANLLYLVEQKVGRKYEVLFCANVVEAGLIVPPLIGSRRVAYYNIWTWKAKLDSNCKMTGIFYIAILESSRIHQRNGQMLIGCWGIRL